MIKSFTLTTLPELFFFFFASIFSSSIALILAFAHRKISLHMLGMSSLTVFCVFCSMKFGFKNIAFLSTLIALNGFVASSRLVMKAHTKTELFLGYIIGAIPQLIMLPLVYSI
jgi:membrane-associated phospholipid phosphatase